jgi:hypothetical protein
VFNKQHPRVRYIHIYYIDVDVRDMFVPIVMAVTCNKEGLSVTPCSLRRLCQGTKYTRAVCKVRGLATVRRCYADGGGECHAKL